MQSSIGLNWNEQLLIQEQCMRMKGPLAYNGMLILTDQKLVFQPTGRLDRLIGADTVQISVSEIVSCELSGIEKNLVINTDTQSIRFGGEGAKRVYERLDAVIGTGDSQAALFEPNERVLVQGSAAIYPHGLIASRGEITLTDRRIRFRPGRGLERFLFKFDSLDKPLSWIQNIRMANIQRLLVVEGENGTYRFGGPLISTLYSSLRALGVSEESTVILKNTQRSDTLVNWEASLVSKLIHYPGHLIAGPSNLSFSPKNRLDNFVGARNITIPLGSLTRLEVAGWPEKRLVLSTSKTTWAFTLDEPEDRLHILPKLLSHHMLDGLSTDDEDILGFDVLMEAWKSQVNLDATEPILLTGPCLHWQQENSAVRGALGLTTEQLIFLPIEEPKQGGRCILVPLESISPIDSGDKSNIRMETEDGILHFTPLAGDSFAEAFWMLSGQLVADEASFELESTRSSQAALTRVLGDLMYLSIYSDEQNLATMRPAFTMEHSDGLGIALEGCPDLELARDQDLVIEFGQPEGTYQFDARVVRTGPVPIALQRKRRKAHDLLLVSPPIDLRFHNRRGGYRVHGYEQLDMVALLFDSDDLDSGHEVALQLENLSIGGCGATSHDFIPEGSRVRLELPIGETMSIPVIGSCRRALPPVELGAPWRYGLQFEKMSDTVRDRISQELLKRQREELFEKSMDED